MSTEKDGGGSERGNLKKIHSHYKPLATTNAEKTTSQQETVSTIFCFEIMNYISNIKDTSIRAYSVALVSEKNEMLDQLAHTFNRGLKIYKFTKENWD